jgi:hypothetical protein
MSDEFTRQLEGDLAQFRKLTSASELQRVQLIIHDYSLSLEELNNALSPGIFRLLFALLDPGNSDLLGESTPRQLSEEIASARIFASRELNGFLKHPGIAKELRWREELRISEESGRRALEQNRIINVVKDCYFEEDDGKLSPRVRVALVGNENGSTIVATYDIEDIMLLVDELIAIARQEAERCMPFAEKEMLVLSFAGLVGPLIKSIDTHVCRIRELAPKLGVDLGEVQKDELKPEG